MGACSKNNDMNLSLRLRPGAFCWKISEKPWNLRVPRPKEGAEVKEMSDIGIFDQGDAILRRIGEELIRERHPGLNFFFISDPSLLSGDYVVVFEEGLDEIKGGVPILLTRREGTKGIFFFASKERIKEGILSAIGPRSGLQEAPSRPMKVFVTMGSGKGSQGTILAHALGMELASCGFRPCLLSLNFLFPLERIGQSRQYKGLLKAMTYLHLGEPLHPGLLSMHPEGSYHYMESDISFGDIPDLGVPLLSGIGEMLGREGFTHFVLDIPPYLWTLFLAYRSSVDLVFWLGDEGEGLEGLVDQEVRKNLLGDLAHIGSGHMEEGSFYALREGRIWLNQHSEAYRLWRMRSKERF